MSDNALKKEFKPSDVERIRNLVNKDYTLKDKKKQHEISLNRIDKYT